MQQTKNMNDEQGERCTMRQGNGLMDE